MNTQSAIVKIIYVKLPGEKERGETHIASNVRMLFRRSLCDLVLRALL